MTMSGEQKAQAFNIFFKTAMVIIGSLIAVIFYSLKDNVENIGRDVVTIRIQMQRVDDKLDTHGDAINKLNHEVDYLQKVKRDK